MEGLEATEIQFKNLNQDKRIDAEYYDKNSISLKNYLEKKSSKNLSEFISSITDMGAFSLYKSEYFVEKGIPFLRVNNIHHNYMDLDDTLFITPEYHQTLKKSQVKKNDVLLTTKAIIGMSCTAPDDIGECNMSQNLVKISVKNNEINPYFLSTFLNSEFGKSQTLKAASGNVQLYLNFEKIKSIKIPKIDFKFQEEIEIIIKSAEILKDRAKKQHIQSIFTLLNKLNITSFSKNIENINIKSFKESFLSTGRLDAEYYQAKYDELEAKIAETHTLGLLRDFVTTNQRGTQPNYAEEGLPVINSKHVREGEVLLSDDNRFAILPDKDDALTIKKGDVLINGTGVGTIGRSAPYLHEEEAIPDNHVTILRTDKIDPIFLSVYLNSIAGKYQVEKYFKGSSGQIELYPTDIGNFYVPIVESSIQIQIADFVRQSFTLKAKSEQLLEAAKRAVEIAIENSEEAAMHYLEPFLQDNK